MTLPDLNKALVSIAEHNSRDNILEFSFALLQWMNIAPNTGSKPQLLSPQTQKLKEFLANAPKTVQPQLYRLSADNQNIKVRFAVLKKLKKEYISQLVDNDPGLTSYQASAKGIITIPGKPQYIPKQPYFIHFVTTPDYDKLVLIFSQGDQKRIIAFRKRLTATQFNKIVPVWQGVGIKPKPEIADLLWKSLDIKEVNKEFYKQIKERFDALVGIVNTQNNSANELQVKQFTVRTIGRYIFCWFLKEKDIIPHSLISKEAIKNTPDFYQTVLLKLFFETLNTKVEDRDPKMQNKQFEKIPYLNGGLFDESEEDKLFMQLNIDEWLLHFVEVLESFDFTVDESSSQYQQVAIDPEMLGRIFENLLASQNEETQKLANQRKAFGAFYTPREIVDYMVNESLKAYLETAIAAQDSGGTTTTAEPQENYGPLFAAPASPVSKPENTVNEASDLLSNKLKEKIEKLFGPDCSENPFNKEETQKVRKALSDVKVLDPACGSGAFPMGMLLRLMELRHIVGHGHKNNYELKSEILSQNIYGVDIMPMAVEIARLRAWLSLVLEAEYKPADKKNNFGISALPNLDFKFVCANSLIDIPEHKYVSNEAEKQLIDFEILTAKYFGASMELKEAFKAQIDKCINDIIAVHERAIQNVTNQIRKEKNSSSESRLNKIKLSLDDYERQRKQWQSYKNIFVEKQVEFFSIKYFFPSVKEGFDIVIGNPPYVQMQKDNGHLARQLESAGYSTFERTGDVYAIFYEFGYRVLRKGGIHTFITSSQWLKANYGKSLRKLFLSKNPLKLISLGPGVFESAVVDTNILIAKNEPRKNELKGCIVDNPGQLTNLSALPLQSMHYVSPDDWSIVGDIKQSISHKLKEKGKALKEWELKINRGILTGYNEAFIIVDTKRKELIEADARSSEIIRPILRGREIEKYFTEWDGSYVISTFPALKINIDEFKPVKDHLEKFLPKLKQTGETYINSGGNTEKTRKKTGNKWYETQDQIGFHGEFLKEKIIWKRIGSQLRFSYSDSEIYCLDSTCIATGEKMKYLTALLNSKLCRYQLFETAPRTGMGDLIISVQALEPLPVYYPSAMQEKKIVEIVDEILKRKKANMNTIDLENRIDVIVYKLYALTYEEIKVIDEEFGLSEEEYNNMEM